MEFRSPKYIGLDQKQNGGTYICLQNGTFQSHFKLILVV
jgi:hypothetical protein